MGKSKYDVKHVGTTHHFKATPKPKSDFGDALAIIGGIIVFLFLLGSCAG